MNISQILSVSRHGTSSRAAKKVEFGLHMSMEIELRPCTHRRMGELVLEGSGQPSGGTMDRGPVATHTLCTRNKKKKKVLLLKQNKNIKTLHGLESWAR